MITDLQSIFSSWLHTCNLITAHFKICRNICVPNGYIKKPHCVSGLGNTLCAYFYIGPHIPLFLGARFGEYLVCQLLVGPHIPLFLRCRVWGVPGLPTFSWTSYSPIFEVPGFSWTSFPLFLRCQVWRVPGLPTFSWTSFPLFLRCQVWGIPGPLTFRWTSYFPINTHKQLKVWDLSNSNSNSKKVLFQ